MKNSYFAALPGFALLALWLALGCSKSTTQSTIPPPAPPTEFTATQINFTTIRFTWRDNSGDESQFHVERTTDSVAGAWQVCAVAERNTTATLDTSFAGGTQYYYRVRAYNGNGNGDPSNIVPLLAWADLPAPHLSTAQISHFAVKLTWTDESSAEDSFRIERTAFRIDSHWPTILDPGQNVTTAEDSLITPSATYFYRVCALNEHGQSPYSNVDSVVTLPAFPPPSGLVTAQHVRSLVDVSWNAVPQVDSVRVEHSPDSVSWATAGAVAGDSSSLSDPVSLADHLTFYRICSLDSVGRSSYSAVAPIWTWPAVYDFATDQTNQFTASGVVGTPTWQWDTQQSAGKVTISHPGSGGGVVRVVTNYTLPNAGWFECKFKVTQWFGSGLAANYAAFSMKRGPAQTDKVFGVTFRRDSTFAGYYSTDSTSGFQLNRVATNPQLPVVTENVWHRVQIFHHGNQWALYVDGTRYWNTSNLFFPLGDAAIYQEWEFTQGNGPDNQVYMVDDWANDSTSP